jgi:hypothetical protein
MKQTFKSRFFILLLKNAGEEWEELNVAVEKREKMKSFVNQEYRK